MLLEILPTLIIAVALGCDAFAVGLSLGTKNPGRMACLKVSFSFGFFQFAMPILGWFIGLQFIALLNSWGQTIAAGVLLIVAAKMLLEGLTRPSEKVVCCCCDMTEGLYLLFLSLATSIDALGVGFSMGIVNSRLFLPALIIGLVTAGMTFVGLGLGAKLCSRFGKKVEILGALLLFYVAINFSSLCQRFLP